MTRSDSTRRPNPFRYGRDLAQAGDGHASHSQATDHPGRVEKQHVNDEKQRTHRDDQRPARADDDEQERNASENEDPDTVAPGSSGQAQRKQDRQLESGEENPT